MSTSSISNKEDKESGREKKGKRETLLIILGVIRMRMSIKDHRGLIKVPINRPRLSVILFWYFREERRLEGLFLSSQMSRESPFRLRWSSFFSFCHISAGEISTDAYRILSKCKGYERSLASWRVSESSPPLIPSLFFSFSVYFL